MEIVDTLIAKYKQGDLSIKLIYIFVGIYILGQISQIAFNFNFTNWFILYGDISSWIHRPWALLTYPFVHGGFIHLLGNMLLLYISGKLFLYYFTEKDFLTFFIFGGLLGGLSFLIGNTLLNMGGPLIGSSAAIYAVFFAMVAYKPEYDIRLFFVNVNIKLKYIAIFLLIVDVLLFFGAGAPSLNKGGHLSHLAGSAFGYFYMRQFEKGNDFLGQALWKSLGKIESLSLPKSSVKMEKPDFNSTKKEDSQEEKTSYQEYKSTRQIEIDRILSKISHSGYDSLTKEEKDFLFSVGKE